ncbi:MULTISPECIES: AraC family transcriptional regulator [Pseudonocardia]|jgi:AraC-like DNA-binding protein|uniref:AraC family transcriptional regulator n=1 Tax=Pseudonocardia TaxID=1847 RepID=UPI000CD1E760|nr:AraC family transcriptional regulator [Pseudonocardia dioxanivorans]GJF06061.1 AraC family transcriptional regulator [Pseudonocardia sp. D17]
MTTFELSPEERLSAGDLIATFAERTSAIGPNPCDWPGLTFYRFVEPAAPQWDDVSSLSLCIVVQGRKCVTVDGAAYHYDPFSYLILNRTMRFQAEILEASVEKPFLSLVLQIDPTIVRRISADMLDRSTTVFRGAGPERPEPARVSPLDQNLLGAALRFVKAVGRGSDRRVLAPIYLQEVVYRILQAEQCERLIAAAAAEIDRNPVSDVISYLDSRIDEPVTVAELAEHVSMSPSAFAHMFRDVTGMSPYQFFKRMRLDRARVLLVEEHLTASETSRRVGYTSLSHFINEFKRHFGVTPRAYAESQRNSVAFNITRSTSPE